MEQGSYCVTGNQSRPGDAEGKILEKYRNLDRGFAKL